MKTKNHDVYLKLLDEYLSGNGLNWGLYNLQKKDVLDMVSFYGRILKPETFILIIQTLVSDLLYIE